MHKIKVEVESIKSVANGTTEVTFNRSESFEFLAGQYVQLALQDLKYPDPKGSSRVFSICSSVQERNTISVVFRDTGSGYKRTLSELSKESTVYLEGPSGHFTLPSESDRKHVFIAGGIGIAPFLSMIRTSFSSDKNFEIDLLYANRDEESSAYLKELRDLGAASKYFSLNTVFGRIEMKDIEKHTTNENVDILWWIVGPPGMVAEVKGLLESGGIQNDKIRIEEFIGY